MSYSISKRALYYFKKAFYFLKNRPIYIHEPAFVRLHHSVPGWVEKGHIYCFDYAIKNLPDDSRVVEIGTYAGLSTNIILYYLNKYNKENSLITTDWYHRDMSGDEEIVNLKEPLKFRDYLKESFVRNVKFFNPQATKIQSTDWSTDELFEAWNKKETVPNLFGGEFIPEGKIGFAYIDGNHKYDYAKRDFENVDKLLVKGGFILFDDSADYTDWGSKTVAQEAVKTGRYKIIKKNPHYFLQKL